MHSILFLVLGFIALGPFSSFAFSERVGAQWSPTQNDSLYIQLQGDLKNVSWASVYDVDLFDTSKEKIAALQVQGKKVVCYFSAGSYEDWRSDAKLFPQKSLGKVLDGWEGERWIDVRSKKVRSLMRERLDLAVAKGCNGVDPDNIDGYTNKTGFPLRYADSLSYNRFLAQEAHARGLAVGLKNGMDMLPDLVASFDFAVNEQCNEYHECDVYRDFIKLGKPVFNIEYKTKYRRNLKSAFDALCASSAKLGITSYVFPRNLDGNFVIQCSN